MRGAGVAECCYVFVLWHSREWPTAERECEARHGHLVTIRDAATNQFLYNTMVNELHFKGVVFIGLSDSHSEDDWRWVDGSRPTYTNWASGQPGFGSMFEDCAAIDTAKGDQWHDYSCEDVLFLSKDHFFICDYRQNHSAYNYNYHYDYDHNHNYHHTNAFHNDNNRRTDDNANRSSNNNNNGTSNNNHNNSSNNDDNKRSNNDDNKRSNNDDNRSSNNDDNKRSNNDDNRSSNNNDNKRSNNEDNGSSNINDNNNNNRSSDYYDHRGSNYNHNSTGDYNR
nr:hypothetical protein BaRGS_021665 [Batillaria attramentaria]